MKKILFFLLISTAALSQPYNGAPKLATTPQGDESAMLVRQIPQDIDRIGFTKALSNSVDSDWGTIVSGIGAGQDVDQTGSNLVITTGTTARSETIIRSTESWIGGIRLRARSTLSSRIINTNFFIELVDVIGDGLAYTISSATVIVVTFPSGHGFTAENVGQSMYLGLFSGTGTFLSGRYPIASVSGDNITFTVSGFAAGTGTCSAFGWNYYQLHYTGTTATNANFDTQRNGWATGATNATINTTASPGHMAIITGNDLISTFSDQLVASATTIQQSVRANRNENIPDDKNLRLQIRIANGSTAPASSITWTIGLISVSHYANTDVAIQDVKPQGLVALPVEIMRGVALATQPVSGTITANQGTMVALPAGANTIGQVSLPIPEVIIDVASAAITSTATTGTLTPTRGASYYVEIPITAVTGTNPTADFIIEEGDGTNWFTVWCFERVTGTGVLRSPLLPDRGNRIRYVQTIGGSTPSFTRAINRYQSNQMATPKVKLVDRSISLTTLNSTSPVIQTGGASIVQLVLSTGAITTTAPQVIIEGSDDNFLTFYTLPVSALTAVASSTVQTTLVAVSSSHIRAKVSVAGVGVTLNSSYNIMLKAY
jgi:hypothetical protein